MTPKRNVNRLGHPLSGAFTLVELLVVIAIIALLAAILFPVFGRARENARKSTCQSNMKQIGLGVMQYTQDFDEMLPTPSIWPELIQPYVNSEQIFICPSDENESSNGSFVSFHSSYLGNIDTMRWNWGTATEIPVRLSGIAQPATTVFSTEGGVRTQTTSPYVRAYSSNGRSKAYGLVVPPGTAANLNNPDHFRDKGADANNTTCTTGSGNSVSCYAGPYPWHSVDFGEAPVAADFVNVGFLDGHVKATQLEDFYYPNSPYLDPRCGTGGSHRACP